MKREVVKFFNTQEYDCEQVLPDNYRTTDLIK